MIGRKAWIIMPFIRIASHMNFKEQMLLAVFKEKSVMHAASQGSRTMSSTQSLQVG